MCNHLVPTAAPIPDKIHWAYFEKLLEDPLVQVMLPIPRAAGDRCFYISDNHDDLGLYLTCLSRLSSPITAVVKPTWMTRVTEIERKMTGSNIQAWVMTQTTTKDQGIVNTVAKGSSYLPRTVVFTGKDEIVVPAPMKRIATKIRDFNLEDLMTLPLESLGALIIRRFARKESLSGPIELRQDRRDRMIDERNKV